MSPDPAPQEWKHSQTANRVNLWISIAALLLSLSVFQANNTGSDLLEPDVGELTFTTLRVSVLVLLIAGAAESLFRRESRVSSLLAAGSASGWQLLPFNAVIGSPSSASARVALLLVTLYHLRCFLISFRKGSWFR